MDAFNVLAPVREKDIADVVREAAARSETLEIAGGGTKRGIGQPFEATRTISTSGLSGIVAYDPAELVFTARAGTPMADIEAALAEHNQMMAFEPADWRGLFAAKGKPTIGAVAAANLSGPRRITAGAARDGLLGVRFVNGAGEIIKNGGRVMKNVTGLDLVKALAGSWGTLALLTEVSFKVLPRPETQATLAIHGASAQQAAPIMAAAMGSSAEVTGAAHLPDGVAGRIAGGALAGRPAAVLRVEGFAASVKARIARLRAILPGDFEMSVLEQDQSEALWRAVRDVEPFAGDPKRPLWKISVAPMSGHSVAGAILEKAAGAAFQDWQGGLVWLQLDDPADAAAETVRGAVRTNGGGHATLLRAADAIHGSVPVFQPHAMPVAALAARVKAAFDPTGVFNPGRMVFDGGRKTG